MFDFLDGVSPIWWLVFGVLLGLIELGLPTTFLIWPAVASLLIAALLVVDPALSGEWQIGTFALLSVAATFVGKYAFSRFEGRKNRRALNLNDPIARNIGSKGRIVSVANGQGVVLVNGVRWQARWNDDNAPPSEGDLVTVLATDESTLIVSSVD